MRVFRLVAGVLKMRIAGIELDSSAYGGYTWSVARARQRVCRPGIQPPSPQEKRSRDQERNRQDNFGRDRLDATENQRDRPKDV